MTLHVLKGGKRAGGAAGRGATAGQQNRRVLWLLWCHIATHELSPHPHPDVAMLGEP